MTKASIKRKGGKKSFTILFLTTIIIIFHVKMNAEKLLFPLVYSIFLPLSLSPGIFCAFCLSLFQVSFSIHTTFFFVSDFMTRDAENLWGGKFDFAHNEWVRRDDNLGLKYFSK